MGSDDPLCFLSHGRHGRACVAGAAVFGVAVCGVVWRGVPVSVAAMLSPSHGRHGRHGCAGVAVWG